jgi:hypothetical protein
VALDIGIGNGSSLCPLATEPQLSLDDDGYYWFLHPFIEELRTTTGQYIDLYGDASFSGEHLVAMKSILARTRELIESQPERWEVCTGSMLIPWQQQTRSPPQLKKSFSTVEKQRFLHLLYQWDRVISRAEELKQPIVCFGD